MTHHHTTPSTPTPGLSIEAKSYYEMETRTMVQNLREELMAIKMRLDNLLFVVIGGVLLEAIMRWLHG